MSENVRVVHCAYYRALRVLLFSYKSIPKFTTNSNKNIQFGIIIFSYENYKITHLYIYWKYSQNNDRLENKLNYQSAHKMSLACMDLYENNI